MGFLKDLDLVDEGTLNTISEIIRRARVTKLEWFAGKLLRKQMSNESKKKKGTEYVVSFTQDTKDWFGQVTDPASIVEPRLWKLFHTMRTDSKSWSI